MRLNFEKIVMNQKHINRRAAVVGAGIAGLTAAKKLADKGYEVDIFDSANRTGGKIRTVRMKDGQIADLAAEFIDTTQTNLIELCKQLNVPLIPTMEEGSLTCRFSIAGGQVLNTQQFASYYAPITAQINADKQAIRQDPAGMRAQALDGMSVKQYLEDLASRTNPRVPEQIIHVVQQGYAAERSRPATGLSALQFVYDAGKEPEDFIDSDCMYRVQGGTGRLIEALTDDLQRKGVRFHLGNKVTEVAKKDGQFTLKTANVQISSAPYDQIIMAAPPHVVPTITGIENLGLGTGDIDLLQQAQFTHNTKITIKTNIPVKNDGFTISQLGYQAWHRAPGEVVFLIGDDLPIKYKPTELLHVVLEDYARTRGLTADQLFDKSQISFGGPNPQHPCYVAPAPGQVLKLQKLAEKFDQLASQGVGFVGTYIPQQEPGSRTCGYMADGVASAERAVERLAAGEQKQAALPASASPMPPTTERYGIKPQINFMSTWAEKIMAEQQTTLSSTNTVNR